VLELGVGRHEEGRCHDDAVRRQVAVGTHEVDDEPERGERAMPCEEHLEV
jgi:hypothetical protein